MKKDQRKVMDGWMNVKKGNLEMMSDRDDKHLTTKYLLDNTIFIRNM